MEKGPPERETKGLDDLKAGKDSDGSWREADGTYASQAGRTWDSIGSANSRLFLAGKSGSPGRNALFGF